MITVLAYSSSHLVCCMIRILIKFEQIILKFFLFIKTVLSGDPIAIISHFLSNGQYLFYFIYLFPFLLLFPFQFYFILFTFDF